MNRSSVSALRMQAALLALLWLGLLSGCHRPDPGMLGTLEWQRISLRTPAAERIEQIHVREGQRVDARQPIATLDGRLVAARAGQAEADVARSRALLDELLAGPRGERIASARARQQRARGLADNATRERRRIEALVAQSLLPRAELDRARTAEQAARSELAALSAETAELVAGSRNEQIVQAEAAVAAAEAAALAARLTAERLQLSAPRPGVVESLPFEVGDEPPAGATIATLLVGDAPYARVYVPQQRRAGIAPGDPMQVRLDDGRVLEGRLRAIASEPSFTPYYALAGDDVDLLVYVAEIELGTDAADLPAGLPLSATTAAVDAAE